MKDAFGGILNIFIIVVVLILIEGLLGLVVNYTKAFRMKNYIISAFEEFEASHCGDNEASACHRAIVDKAKELGFSRNNKLECPLNYENGKGFFCYQDKWHDSDGNYIYSIEVQIDINIPIVRNIMGMSIFRVRGDTRVINKK